MREIPRADSDRRAVQIALTALAGNPSPAPPPASAYVPIWAGAERPFGSCQGRKRSAGWEWSVA